MGDYAHLVKIPSGNPAEEYPWEDILLFGKYMLPFIWTTIYTPEHIRERETESALYDVLMVPGREALTLATERKARFLDLFAEPMEEAYAQWVDILHGVGECHLMLDVDDLRGSSFSRDFDAKLPQWAGAMNGASPESLQFALRHGILDWNEHTGKVTFFDPKLDMKGMINWILGG